MLLWSGYKRRDYWAMEKGAKTLADIKRMTGACCSCKCAELNPSGKCCAQDIALVMKEYLSNKNS